MVISQDNQFPIPYPALRSEAPPLVTEKPEARKRAEGRSFHHGRFVSRLRAAAMSHANITVFETEATSLIKSSASQEILGVESITRKTQRDFFFGSLTVVCDGYA